MKKILITGTGGTLSTTVSPSQQLKTPEKMESKDPSILAEAMSLLIPDYTPSGNFFTQGEPRSGIPSRSMKIKSKRLRAHNERCKRKKR